MSTYHTPVLIKETLDFLNIQKGNWYIDGTLGGGGHTKAILDKGGKVIAIDLDPESIKEVASHHNLELTLVDGKYQGISKNLMIFQSNFSFIDEIIKKANIYQSGIEISGILFDLGVSTHQLETANRGFSFNLDAPLDMRMDQTDTATAADLVNGLHEGELAKLFLKLGEEKFNKKIAKKIVEKRTKDKIKTTAQLAQIILNVRPKGSSSKKHPATRVFQALRIAVNDELNNLKIVLPKALEIVKLGGRLLVISFQSLEDRIVKNYFKDAQKLGQVMIIIKKPVETSQQEIAQNPKSRSAKLRAVQKN